MGRNCHVMINSLARTGWNVVHTLTPNGPAIKCRLCWFGHGGCEQKCLIGVKSWYTAVMNKPWRGFCRPGTRFCGHYECRGTRVVASRS